MKILIVSRFFPPDNTPRSYRTYELARMLSLLQHEVTLLIPNAGQRNQNHIGDALFSLKNLGETKFSDVVVKPPFSFLKRIWKRISGLFFQYPDIEMMWMVKQALKQEHGYDLLISIAMPHSIHWGVAWAYRKNNPIARVWVADCGDPFMGQENDTFKPPFYFSLLEKWFCKKADYISVPVEGAKEAYYAEFRSKIRVIPQGFDFNAIQLHIPKRSIDKIEFGYAGVFIPGKRDPKEFIQYLQQHKGDFIFHIYTKTPNAVLPYMKLGDSRIQLHPPLPRFEVLSEMAAMDFVVNFENAGTRQMPSKLIDYAIVKKPVLSIVTGALDKEAVDQFLSGNYSKQMVLGNMDAYRIENVCKQFLVLAESHAAKDQK